jgi:predicted transcriptional regulator of viral defense system
MMQHMQTITEIALQKAKRGVFTRREAAYWADNDGARLDALLKRSVSTKEVVRICRGLFYLANKYTQGPIHSFELSQRIFGPSYISLESALSHHGWIPEAVYSITSVSQKRSRDFKTPLGLFSYTRIPQNLFFAGVRREELADGGTFLVAEPLKALADYIHAHSCDWLGIAPVVESLRIEETELAALTTRSFEQLEGVYRSTRVCRFLESIQKEMKL